MSYVVNIKVRGQGYLINHKRREQMRFLAILLVSIIATAGSAQNWYEPERGSDTRSALMDAIRPHVAWWLGDPIQFVVGELRVSGDVGFATLHPQRPGGKSIDLRQTPGYINGWLEPDWMDGSRVDVLYKKQGQTWVAVHHAIGATDVWYSAPQYCREYRSVIPEWCN